MSKLIQAAIPVSIALGIFGATMLKVDAGNFHATPPVESKAAVVEVSVPDERYLKTPRHANRTHYTKCRFEKRERWSKRRGELVMRNTKVCS